MYKEGNLITVDKNSLSHTKYYDQPIFTIEKIDNINHTIMVKSDIGKDFILNKKNILPIEIDSDLSKKIRLDYVIMASISFSNQEIPVIEYDRGYFKDTLNKFSFSDSIEPLDISNCKFVHEVQDALEQRPEFEFKLVR